RGHRGLRMLHDGAEPPAAGDRVNVHVRESSGRGGAGLASLPGAVRLARSGRDGRHLLRCMAGPESLGEQGGCQGAPWCAHSNIGEVLASTSSMTASGMLSNLLPPRAVRSRTRGWSQRTTPVVLVPA